MNMKNHNVNNFNGTMNFNGPTQIATGDIINSTSDVDSKMAHYTPEPIWRSPITLAILTWISVVIGIAGLFPLGNIVKSLMDFFGGNSIDLFDSKYKVSLIFLIIFSFLLVFVFSLRRIAKKQTRHPLILGFAISGYGERLTIEKIHTDKCPQCGGKMKYYNSPVEWRDISYEDGRIKREITKRVPALECKRNAEHWYMVDPAEDIIEL